MKCPLCFQPIHSAAESCPHCGGSIEELDQLYSDKPREVSLLNDGAGMLRVADRKKVQHWIKRFRAEFPQCYLSVSIVNLKDEQDARSYGLWILNQGEFRDLAGELDERFGLVLVIDAKKKEVALVYGYQHEPYMTELACFNALVPAHPYLLDGEYLKGIEVMRHGVRVLMRKNARRSMGVLKRKGLLGRIVS